MPNLSSKITANNNIPIEAMRKTKVNQEKNDIKEKAFDEFRKGKLTQRDIANKYGICETELSRFFSGKLNSLVFSTSYQTK